MLFVVTFFKLYYTPKIFHVKNELQEHCTFNDVFSDLKGNYMVIKGGEGNHSPYKRTKYK